MENQEQNPEKQEPTTTEQVQGGIGCIKLIVIIIMIGFAVYTLVTL